MIILTKVNLACHIFQLLETFLFTILFTKYSVRVGSANCFCIVLIKVELEVCNFDSRHKVHVVCLHVRAIRWLANATYFGCTDII